jgi:predicted dehydrogenase
MKMKKLDSRRSFIGKMAKGVAFTSVALSTVPSQGASKPGISLNDDYPVYQKPIRIGIIGAENSHTVGYGQMFNIDKKFPGVEVLYVWGETDDFAKAAAEKGKIPNIVKNPEEMIGKIDALIVDHRHPKYHLEAAIPFIKAKIPTFIDKPFCYRVSEGKKFLELARSVGTPVSSWSTSAHTDKVMDIKNRVGALGQINNIVGYGPVDIESQWGGVFFYGVHFTDQLLYIFGDNVSRVRITKNGRTATGSLVFNNGMLATIAFLTLARDSTFYTETKKGMVELKSDVKETDPPRCYIDMVNMFRTGKEPRTHQSILYSMAVLEALERSVSSDNWEKVIV